MTYYNVEAVEGITDIASYDTLEEAVNAAKTIAALTRKKIEVIKVTEEKMGEY